MKITNKTIICVCLITVLIILGVIAFFVLKIRSNDNVVPTETLGSTLSADVTSSVKVLEIPEVTTKHSEICTASPDPRVFIDEDGNVHIDVGGTNENVTTAEPRIVGDVVMIETEESK